MSLEDKLEDLKAYPQADETKYQPKTEFDGTTGYLQTGVLKEAPADYAELLTSFGYNPEVVQIVGHPRVSKWQQRARIRGTSEYETCWLSAFKFQIAAKGSTSAPTDLEAIAKRAKKEPKTGAGPHWMVFQAGDLQIGKRSRDGATEQIVERYFQSLEASVQEFKALKKHGIEGIQISMPGDMCEGNQSQAGQNLWLTQETITEQGRILRRLMMATVEAFAPLVDQVLLTVVNGNHDQAQRQQNTYPGDGWATESAITVADALALNPTAYRHVTVQVPEKWSGSMTIPVGNTIVTVVHGHQWRPGQGFKWWSDQAMNNQPAGAAQILQHGHYHTWQIETTEHKTRIQSGTYDCGSDWYRDKRGATSRRGGLVYLLNGGEVSRMSQL
jgi:predicted phosphodiesterase/DNA-binding protein Fis